MSAFTKLRESDFSATEKRIADYILKNAHKLPEITISTVAKDCDTSKSLDGAAVQNRRLQGL